jgi:hypothetical protein
MALPASGAISLSAVNTELGLSATAAITMNDAAVRTLFGKSSGAITMNDGYGKSSIAPLIAVGWQNPCHSTNGTTWTQDNWPSGLGYINPSQPYQWQFACYGNGKYVAVTNGSFPNTKIAYSTDGINWTASGASPINASFKAAAYGGGVYVLISSQGGANMVTSTNGVDWTSRTVSGGSWDDNCMNYGNGKFVAVSRDSLAVATSSNGTTWNVASSMPTSGWSGCAYGNSIWVAISYVGTGYATSADASTWTGRTLPASGGMNAICFGNGRFVAVGPGGSNGAVYSTDGTNWTRATLPTGTFFTVTYSSSAGLFVAGGVPGSSNVRVATSPDGATWTSRTIPTSAVNGAGPQCIVSAG